jgi:hypothetical protein
MHTQQRSGLESHLLDSTGNQWTESIHSMADAGDFESLLARIRDGDETACAERLFAEQQPDVAIHP